MTKEVFDKLLAEFTQLNENANKAREFILDKEKFEILDPLNRDLLIGQLKAMETYLSILSVRIGINAPKDEQPSDSEEIQDAEIVNE